MKPLLRAGVRGSRSRPWARFRPGVLIALIAVTGVAAAAVTFTYTSPSTITTGTVEPPVQFAAGDDAGPSMLSDHVSAYALSTNRTHFAATVNGVPEATLTVGSFVKLVNTDDADHAVTLTTATVENAYVGAYTLEIRDGMGSVVGTLDLTAAAPSASFTLPAGATYDARLRLTLESGAGDNNVALTNALTLAVT